jgi:hypothetical protein
MAVQSRATAVPGDFSSLFHRLGLSATKRIVVRQQQPVLRPAYAGDSVGDFLSRESDSCGAKHDALRREPPAALFAVP